MPPPDEVRFDGRVGIVTGAGNGLGRAYALELGRRGASVVVNDIGGSTEGEGSSRQTADYVVEEIRQAGGTAIASYDSVAEEAGCRNMVKIAIDAFGRLDAVVHNAGILRNRPFDEMTDDAWEPVVATHLLGGLYLARAAWPIMTRQRYGRLVLTSSGAGLWGRENGVNYTAAKAGLFGMCNGLAWEGRSFGINVNALLPFGASRLNGAPEPSDHSAAAEEERRSAAAERRSPDWVAPIVVYLASEACAFTRRAYSADLGRFAEVFVGVTDGWVAPGPNPPAVEELVAHLSEVDDRSAYVVPESTFDEMDIARGRVEAELAGDSRVADPRGN